MHRAASIALAPSLRAADRVYDGRWGSCTRPEGDAGKDKESTDVMKKKIQFTILALSILCALGLVFVVHGSSAQQSDLVAHIVIPFTNSGTLNPCNGEVVSLSGTVNLRSHVTIDQNGGIHFNIHENTQGLSGTGL